MNLKLGTQDDLQLINGTCFVFECAKGAFQKISLSELSGIVFIFAVNIPHRLKCFNMQFDFFFLRIQLFPAHNFILQYQ